MRITRHETELNDTNMYIVTSEDEKGSIVVDPSETEGIREALDRGIKIDYILLTHEHYDHIAELNDVRKLTGAPVVASRKCSIAIQNENKNLSRHFTTILSFKEKYKEMSSDEYKVESYIAEPADIVFDIKMTFEWRNHSVLMQEAPGHSPGSIIIGIDDEYIFSGDTLSKDFELITKLPGGSMKDYRNITCPLLNEIKKDAKVFPGHGREFMMYSLYK